MTRITKSTFRDGVRELARRDPDMARLFKAAALPDLRSRSTGYGTIMKIISGQQVSTAAARAINGRMEIRVDQIVIDPVNAVVIAWNHHL